jgi:DNA-binding NtrC family response regulator
MEAQMTRLLVVDDEPGIRSIVTRWVEANGFDVSVAGSAGEALDMMATTPAGVALCDVNLPDRNGMWLAAQLRRQYPDVALVITTGYGLRALPSTLDAEAIAYLPKPFTQIQLMQTLDWAMQWQTDHAESSMRKNR